MVVAVVAPVRLTVAPLPTSAMIVPLIVKVCAEVKFAVLFAPLTVTAVLVGVKTKPVLLGVTVYEPFTTVKL